MIELWRGILPEGWVLSLYLLVLRLLALVVVEPVAASLLKVLLQNWLDVVLDLLILLLVLIAIVVLAVASSIGPTSAIIVVVKFCP